jgi:hypothetical protein
VCKPAAFSKAWREAARVKRPKTKSEWQQQNALDELFNPVARRLLTGRVKPSPISVMAVLPY